MRKRSFNDDSTLSVKSRKWNKLDKEIRVPLTSRRWTSNNHMYIIQIGVFDGFKVGTILCIVRRPQREYGALHYPSVCVLDHATVKEWKGPNCTLEGAPIRISFFNWVSNSSSWSKALKISSSKDIAILASTFLIARHSSSHQMFGPCGLMSCCCLLHTPTISISSPGVYLPFKPRNALSLQALQSTIYQLMLSCRVLP